MFDRIKALFCKRELAKPNHYDAELGVLSEESDLWSGAVMKDVRSIAFTVAGNASEPDARLLDRVREVVSRFDEIEHEAVTFLRDRVEEVRASQLTFSRVEFLWEDEPATHTLEWLADGDDSSVWRVTYRNGKPQEAGFDD